MLSRAGFANGADDVMAMADLNRRKLHGRLEQSSLSGATGGAFVRQCERHRLRGVRGGRERRSCRTRQQGRQVSAARIKTLSCGQVAYESTRALGRIDADAGKAARSVPLAAQRGAMPAWWPGWPGSEGSVTGRGKSGSWQIRGAQLARPSAPRLTRWGRKCGLRSGGDR